MLWRAVLCAVGVFLTSLVAQAHSAQPARSLVLQFDKSGVVALWHIEVGADQASLLLALYDLNRDGSLSQLESGYLGVGLLAKAVEGVHISGPTGLLEVTHLQPRVVVSPDKRHVELDALANLAGGIEGGEGFVRVEVAASSGSIVTEFRALAPWHLVRCSAIGMDVDASRCAAGVDIRPGAQVTAGVAH